MKKFRSIHKDVRQVEIETLNHRIVVEYFIPQIENDELYGILFLNPDVRYCTSGMYFSLIENLFHQARANNIAAMRIDFQISDTYTEQEVLNQYITQASVSIDHFKDILGKYKKLIVVGVSGGAYVAMQILLRRVELSGGVIISPHLLHYRFDEFIIPYKTNVHLISRPTDKYIPTNLLALLIKVYEHYGMNIEHTSLTANDDTYDGKTAEIWSIIINLLHKSQEEPKENIVKETAISDMSDMNEEYDMENENN